MFEFIRKHLKVIMIGFFPLMLFAFVFVGMDPAMLGQRSPVVARVAGSDITQNEWDFAHRQQADSRRGEDREISSAALDSPQFRYGVLEGLIRDRIFAATVQDRNYLVSNNQLARTLANSPEIAALRGPDGRLDMQAYRDLLRQYGATPETYEANIRYQLALQQVWGVVMDASLATPEQLQPSMDALFQRREVGVKRFLPSDYIEQVQANDADLQSYYDANVALFQRADTIDVEYLLLDLDSVMDSVEIDEEELRSYYDNNQSAYARAPEQRHARHILFATDANSSTQEREAARERAEQALAQLRSNPDAFADIARAQSDDPGSKDSGGDLGFFAQGAMVADFDNALFELQAGEISGVVATEYGFHIIELLEVRPADTPGYDEIRDRLAEDVQNNLARSQFIEKADLMSNLTHEQPSSLQPVAEALGLSVLTAQGVTREADAIQPQALQSPAVLAALFDARATEEGQNIDAIDIGSNQMVTARVTTLHPAQLLPFDEVRDQVEALYTEQEAARLAQQAGEEELAQWEAQAQNIQAEEELIVSRQLSQGMDALSVQEILTVAPEQFPKPLGFAQPDGSYMLASVQAIAPAQDADVPEDVQTALGDAYAGHIQQLLADAEREAYYETLKQSYKVQVRAPKPDASALQ